MPASLLVALPFLHDMAAISGPGTLPAPQWSGAVRLWPGLPNPPETGWLCPDAYPFTPPEALACLTALSDMGRVAATGLPLGLSATTNATAARHATETALLEGLQEASGDVDAARAAEQACRDRLARQQAHKMLLWAWQQEESLQELVCLAARFAASADELATALGDARDRSPDDRGALTEDLARLDTPLVVDQGLLPAWRLVVANALFFLPTEAAVALEGVAREDALELLDFSPAPMWRKALTATDAVETLEARAPSWKLLGRTRPTGQEALDAERLWVAWRRSVPLAAEALAQGR